MPGVLLIETMAQTSGWLVVAINRFERMPFLAQVREAKFRTFVEPGARLTVSAELEHDGSGYAMTKARIAHEGKPVCNADLTFRVLAFPNDDMSRQMRETAARIGLPGIEATAHG
jgi:3-hydroxyacyl-[acyl-carrier-protein] dehydratase